MYTSSLSRMGSLREQELEGITDWLSSTLEKVSSDISKSIPLYQQYQTIQRQREERKRVQAILEEQKREEAAMIAYQTRQIAARQQQAIVRQKAVSEYMPYLLIGGIGLGAIVLMKKKSRRR